MRRRLGRIVIAIVMFWQYHPHDPLFPVCSDLSHVPRSGDKIVIGIRSSDEWTIIDAAQEVELSEAPQ